MTEREQFEKVRSALEEYTQIPFMSSMGESLNQCCRTLASEGHADDCRGAEALKILEAWQAARATPELHMDYIKASLKRIRDDAKLALSSDDYKEVDLPHMRSAWELIMINSVNQKTDSEKYKLGLALRMLDVFDMAEQAPAMLTAAKEKGE